MRCAPAWSTAEAPAGRNSHVPGARSQQPVPPSLQAAPLAGSAPVPPAGKQVSKLAQQLFRWAAFKVVENPHPHEDTHKMFIPSFELTMETYSVLGYRKKVTQEGRDDRR